MCHLCLSPPSDCVMVAMHLPPGSLPSWQPGLLLAVPKGTAGYLLPSRFLPISWFGSKNGSVIAHPCIPACSMLRPGVVGHICCRSQVLLFLLWHFLVFTLVHVLPYSSFQILLQFLPQTLNSTLGCCTVFMQLRAYSLQMWGSEQCPASLMKWGSSLQSTFPVSSSLHSDA